MKGSNAVLLYCFAKYCQKHLSGHTLQQTFSTSKEQVFFDFGDLALGVRFHKGFGYLYLSESDCLPKKNRLPAFAHAHAQKVAEIKPILAERAIQIRLETGVIEFRLFGNQSVIIWFGEATAPFSFPKKDAAPEPLSADAFLESEVPVDFDSWHNKSRFVEKWMIEDFPIREGLLSPSTWFLTLSDWLCAQTIYLSKTESGAPQLSLKVSAEQLKGSYGLWPEISAAFTHQSIHFDDAVQQKHSQQKALLKAEQQYLRQLQAVEKELLQIQSRNYKQLGDNIMACLHTLQKGMEEARVEDVYSGETLRIPLKKDLNPQENAARYYRKAKKEYLQQQNREELREKLLRSLTECRSALKEIESGNLSPRPEKPLDTSKKSVVAQKFFVFHHEGFVIRVGKNAEGNDQLLREAGKNDFWLHARGYKGAHVMIRCGNQSEKVPLRVKETAASLAAWNSDARSSQLVPVIITQRKFVRKGKGLQKGAVVVDREEVLIVEPASPAELGLND